MISGLAQTSRKERTRHDSDSYVQSRVEGVILRKLSRQEGLSLAAETLRLQGGATVKIDGVDRNARALCEVYAHVGRTRGGQPAKIAKDILKLVAAEKSLGKSWRKIICFSDKHAAACLQGESWLTEVARDLGVEVIVIKLTAKTTASILAAQARQVMVNP